MANSILTAEEADKVAVTHTPRKFPQAIAPVARAFVAYQSSEQKTDFRIEKLVAQQTGISDLERISVERQVEIQALEKLKEIQERAYQEAYNLGRDEGREQAFRTHEAEIKENLEKFEALLRSIETLKVDLVSFNEAHIMKLIYYMASRMAMAEVEQNNDLILNVLKLALEGIQSEESVNVKVAPSDYEFIKGLQEKTGKDLDFLKRMKFETSDSIKSGGCIVETNYGVVDATVEQRLNKLWDSLKDKIPKVKDTIGVDGSDGT